MEKHARDRAALRAEFEANRDKLAALDGESRDVLHELGRHLANLRLDAGFAELGELIRKVENLRGTLRETEAELAHTRQTMQEYRALKTELAGTRREARRLMGRVERQLAELGERAGAVYRKLECPAQYRAYFEDPSAGEDGDDGEEPLGFGTLLRALRRVRPDLDAKDRHAEIGWRLLKSDFDEQLDGDLGPLFERVKKNLVALLQLDRHQKHREESLAAFDQELKKEWKHPTLRAMVRALEAERAELASGLDALYSRLGSLFNKHRLHNYVDDSFVQACRMRLKRFHVRTNELKLRQQQILAAVRSDASLAEGS